MDFNAIIMPARRLVGKVGVYGSLAVDQVEALRPWNVKDLHTLDLTSDLPG